jgi:hypothetical protein
VLRSARERLRENPEASVLKQLVAEFDGLLDRSTGEQHRPKMKNLKT